MRAWAYLTERTAYLGTTRLVPRRRPRVQLQRCRLSRAARWHRCGHRAGRRRAVRRGRARSARPTACRPACFGQTRGRLLTAPACYPRPLESTPQAPGRPTHLVHTLEEPWSHAACMTGRWRCREAVPKSLMPLLLNTRRPPTPRASSPSTCARRGPQPT